MSRIWEGRLAPFVGVVVAVALSAAPALASTGKRGPRGPRGPQGPPGPSIVKVTTVHSKSVHLYPGDNSYEANGNHAFSADCPRGMTVIGTGFDGGIGKATEVEKFGTFVGAFFINDTSVDYDVSIQAICAKGSDAGTGFAMTRTAENEGLGRTQAALAVATDHK